MMTITLSQAFLYSIALAILWLTPGPVWVAILARSISGGFRSSVPLIFGVALGDLLWPLVALLGLSYLISLYADILIIFRYLASIILIIMGLLLIINSKKVFSENSHLTKPGHWAGFIAGLSAVLANPKASLFYMTLLPNFFDFDKINLLDILSYLLPFGICSYDWKFDTCRHSWKNKKISIVVVGHVKNEYIFWNFINYCWFVYYYFLTQNIVPNA